jgi:hypothetical protein
MAIPSSPNAARAASTLVDVGDYTKIPNRLFGSGMAAKLKPTASLFYVALCDHANRNGSNTFKVSDKVLASDTLLAPRTFCNARKRLEEFGLVSLTRQPGERYTYSILKPSLHWVSSSKRPRPKQRPRALHGLKDEVP